MSNIYVQEPPCEGKVCLETTVGEIDIELWSRECPKACRNFVQLCLEGYYDKTKFFRVVPDFIVQGGDPTNSGSGGESIYGGPFKDEFHSRLRLVRRGLVAMANSGKDDNGSQFFFTLAATRELQNKHTVFGKVVGDTIFNMIRLAEGHLEDGDRPKYPHKIIRTRVLINPFPDIVPREAIHQEVEKGKKSKPKSKMKATKDFKLLSFGEEAEDDEESIDVASKSSKGKGKSAHDLAGDSNLLASTDKSQLGVEENSDSSDDDEDDEKRKEAELNSIKDKFLKRKAEKEMMTIRTKLKKTDVVEEFIQKEQEDNKDDYEGEYECPLKKERNKKKEEIQKELKALTKELKPKKKKDNSTETVVEEKLTEKERGNDMLLEFHREQKKYKEKSEKLPVVKKASREEETLKMLAKFKQKLSGLKVDEEKDKIDTEDDDELVGDDWMKNTLRFESNDPVLAKDASTKDDDWFDIYDPRNPLNKRRREKDKIEGDRKEKDRMKMSL